MNNETQSINIFCAKCQTVEAHNYTVDANGELVFTCAGTDCDRFLKLPAGLSTEEYQTLLAAHENDNKGQVSLQDSIDALDALVAAVNSGATPAQPTVEAAPVDTSVDTSNEVVDTTTEETPAEEATETPEEETAEDTVVTAQPVQ